MTEVDGPVGRRVEQLFFEACGYNVMRYAGVLRAHDDDERGVKWKLSPAVSDSWDMIVVGDLAVTTSSMFSGVQVVCYITLPWREEPLSDGDWDLADELLEEIAPHVNHPMYDFAASAMRAQTAGFLFPPRVPRHTPPVELVLARDSAS